MLTLRERLQLLRERFHETGESPRIWMRRRWKSVSLLATLVLGVLWLDGWLLTCGFGGCPTSAEIRAFRPFEGGRVLDRDGRYMGRLEPVRRVNVPLSDVPLDVREAFVATEDRRFLQHHGTDWHGFFRALGRDIGSFGFREGFSTITMQVARNTFVDRRAGDRSFNGLAGKLLEMRVAKKLESTLSKNDILELYMNVIYLGNGVYGVEAASRDLFGKSVHDLSLGQAAMLAALPKAPSQYAPRRHPERAIARRNLVLGLMAQQRYITPDDARNAAHERMVINRDGWRPGTTEDNWAIDAVRSVVDSVLQSMNLDETDVTVVTTLDVTAQKAAERAVRHQAAAIERETRDAYGRIPGPAQGAMIALDPRTGDIRAIVGGRTYERGAFDRAFSAKRQPGSAFKPFVYAAALDGGLTPGTQVDDQPIEIDQGGRIWTPANYNGEYLGRTTLNQALTHSANAATIRVSQSIGVSRTIALAHRLGITSQLDPVPSLPLGTMEVTPYELVTAYATFANGGFRVKPRLISQILTNDGRVLWTSSPERIQVMDARDAFQLTTMLESVVNQGTGRPVRDYGVTTAVAGKTGTTNNGTDVWFVGFTQTLVAGFWFGYDNPHPISYNAAGGRLAAPAWAEFYATGWKDYKQDREWTPPAGVVSAVIDPESGMLATDFCPTRERDWFKQGTEPTEFCPLHTAPEPDQAFGTDSGTFFGQLGNKVSRFFRRIIPGRRIETSPPVSDSAAGATGDSTAGDSTQ